MDIERLTIEEFLEHRREIEAELGDRKHDWAGEYHEAAELVLEDVEENLGTWNGRVSSPISEPVSGSSRIFRLLSVTTEIR